MTSGYERSQHRNVRRVLLLDGFRGLTVDELDRVLAAQALERHQRVAIGKDVGALRATASAIGLAGLARHVVLARAIARAGQARSHQAIDDAARDRHRDQNAENDATDHAGAPPRPAPPANRDRKSTRLNSSHSQISYAVFCL